MLEGILYAICQHLVTAGDEGGHQALCSKPAGPPCAVDVIDGAVWKVKVDDVVNLARNVQAPALHSIVKSSLSSSASTKPI